MGVPTPPPISPRTSRLLDRRRATDIVLAGRRIDATAPPPMPPATDARHRHQRSVATGLSDTTSERNRVERMIDRPTSGLALGSILSLVTIFVVSSSVHAIAEDTDGAHAVRVIVPKGMYLDHPTGGGLDPMDLILGGGGPTRSFPALCDRLSELAKDPEVDTVLFDLSSPYSMNLPQLTELRRRIADVRASGKGTMAWIESGAMPQLAVASACDRVLMADFGTLDFPSLGMSAMHYKDAMDLLGVEASVARAGDYKGAVEPYTRSEISDHLKEHYRAMLRSMNDEVVRFMTEGRGMTTTEVRSAQEDRIFTAREALERGLVDVLVPFGKMSDFVESEHENGVTWVNPRKKVQAPPNFFEVFAELFGVQQEARISEPSIVVLHLDGEIVDGITAVPGTIVSGPAVKEIDKLTADPKVRGVVVRINSPGGSATASEAVRQALAELSSKKPVVISMGSLAASGGYWITCIGRPIYAEAGTITGSIGVFAMKLSFGGLLSRIGLRVTPITLDESAGAMDIARGWTPKETARIETLIVEVYDRFLGLVSDSRGMSTERVDAIGGGRVWSGMQALDNGLVDGIGGTAVAIAHVAREAELPADAPIVHRPGPINPFASLDLFGGGREEEIRGRIDVTALRILREAGFDLRGPMRRVLESIRNPGPKILVLSPTNLVVR